MIHINVTLPSGHTEILTLLPSSTVQDVRTAANEPLGESTSDLSLPRIES